MGLLGGQESSSKVMATKVAILLAFLTCVAGEGVLERLQKRAQYSEVGWLSFMRTKKAFLMGMITIMSMMTLTRVTNKIKIHLSADI